MAVCCICLDSASSANPLFLLACGCKSGWFHTPCEYQWMNSIDESPTCPTCRRDVAMKINYSFSFYAGEHQEMLWKVFALFLFEASISSYLSFYLEHILIFPLQSVSIAICPFIIRSEHTLHNYLLCVYARYISIFAYIVFENNIYISVRPLIALSYVYIFFIYLYTIKNRNLEYNHPLTPYMISKEISHVQSITKTPPSSAKSHKIFVRKSPNRTRKR